MLVGVVAHHRRTATAESLARQVTADYLSIDPGDPLDVADGCRRAADNHIAVLKWMAAKSNISWAIVLEDDAHPAPRLRYTLHRAFHHTPSLLVGLYLGTGNPSGPVQRAIQPVHLRATACGAAWLTADWFTSSVGYAVHRSVLGDMLDFISPMDCELPLRITRWAQEMGIRTAYTRPSLVDHDDHDSVVYPQEPGNRLPRKAWSYGRRDDWATRALHIEGHCPPWSPFDGCMECERRWAAHGWQIPSPVAHENA